MKSGEATEWMEAHVLWLPGSEMIHLLLACLGKTCSTHRLLPWVGEGVPSSWQISPWFIWVKVHEGFLPMGTECSLDIIQEILLPVSVQSWEEQDRCLPGYVGCSKGGREGRHSLRQKSHEQWTFIGTDTDRSVRLPCCTRWGPKDECHRRAYGRHPIDIYSVSLLNSWTLFSYGGDSILSNILYTIVEGQSLNKKSTPTCSSIAGCDPRFFFLLPHPHIHETLWAFIFIFIFLFLWASEWKNTA